MKTFIRTLAQACYGVIRPIFGPRGVCIYHISCSEYTKQALSQYPLYKSLPLITLRLLSCNPITPLLWKIKKLIKQKK